MNGTLKTAARGLSFIWFGACIGVAVAVGILAARKTLNVLDPKISEPAARPVHKTNITKKQ